MFESQIQERAYNTALLNLELPFSFCAVAISLVDCYKFTVCQFPFPTFWGIYAHAQTVYTRPSSPPTLIIADDLGIRLVLGPTVTVIVCSNANH